MEEYVTVCPRNCNSTGTFRVQVVNNKIRREILKIAQLHSIAENEGHFPACTNSCPGDTLDFGELSDRIIFYINFNPVNINTLINTARYETKRN